ncbi:hypothetical protein [Rhodovulum sp. P5]|uniref:hypothetical protein n=1 Tax=Rhodovulum sp. P5 TaxID=1564506 RepID=UPI0012EC8ED1|nr:hypothetical protein [Rhodovulum sp. P5]
MTGSATGSGLRAALYIYGSLFRNPAAIIFMLLFLLAYSIIALVLVAQEPIDLLELVKAAPFAASALVLGVFSVLFWALNYMGRTQKSELKCEEVARLFEIRRRAIEEIFSDSSAQDSTELAVFKAHLLLATGEVNWEPESPPSSLAFDYGEAVKAILRRS